MHAEILIVFADDVRETWLTAGLPAASDPRMVLAMTQLHDRTELLPTAMYARLETTFVHLLFSEDSRSVKAYLEGRVDKRDLRQLARRAEHLSETIIRTGGSHGVGLHSAAINLYAEEAVITTGTRRDYGERLLGRFRETIFGDVIVGLLTGLFTGMFTGERRAAVAATLASVLCFLLWLTIEIGGGRDAYEYTGL